MSEEYEEHVNIGYAWVSVAIGLLAFAVVAVLLRYLYC